MEGVAESWVEAEMSWVEVGERFANAQFYYACKKHVAQSNDGTYLAIFHLDLGGNEIRQYKEIAVLGPSTLSRLRECSYRSLFLF